jgi:CRP/FNR family transcriptional regulator, cyclic AMP receptor protein
MASQFLDERTYDTGDIVFREGDRSSEMFIVQEGMVVLTRQVAGNEVFLETLERGDFFGEIALLESLPRGATCRAMGSTRLLAIRTGELLMKLRRDPTFAFEMLQRMSKRIRFLNEQMAAALESEKLSREELSKLKGRSEYLSKDRP